MNGFRVCGEGGDGRVRFAVGGVRAVALALVGAVRENAAGHHNAEREEAKGVIVEHVAVGCLAAETGAEDEAEREGDEARGHEERVA